MGYRYEPELAAAAAQLPQRDLSDLPAVRRAIRQTIAAQPPVDTTGVHVTDRLIPGLPGEPEVEIRVYHPQRDATGAPGPAILHAHGGGFVMCDLESSHARNTELARELGATLVSVDYRLAPEHPFPAALHDVHAALLWLVEHADALGVDPARIAVHGISAGAGLERVPWIMRVGCGRSLLCLIATT
ncbi:alpha/beta hydrolase [Pseudonocardia nigra]|uniref:alpha/beta hydrolase n=1 Tax=Pseudonocardia nigra TaxID=1921578 RepID=UPI001C5F122F|nr:alpha/beta hydrolase fold domain-containing protein [Pseudonocardia nigra]